MCSADQARTDWIVCDAGLIMFCSKCLGQDYIILPSLRAMLQACLDLMTKNIPNLWT